MEYRESNYLNVERNSSKYYANPGNYEDQIINNNDFIDKVAIPSKVIKENFLKVFVVFNDIQLWQQRGDFKKMLCN